MDFMHPYFYNDLLGINDHDETSCAKLFEIHP